MHGSKLEIADELMRLLGAPDHARTAAGLSYFSLLLDAYTAAAVEARLRELGVVDAGADDAGVEPHILAPQPAPTNTQPLPPPVLYMNREGQLKVACPARV